VGSQSTTEMLRTSKSSSRTVNNTPFLQPPVHSAGIYMVNMTSSHSSCIQTAGKNMSAANQPAASNVSVPQGNGPISSAELTLETVKQMINQLLQGLLQKMASLALIPSSALTIKVTTKQTASRQQQISLLV